MPSWPGGSGRMPLCWASWATSTPARCLLPSSPGLRPPCCPHSHSLRGFTGGRSDQIIILRQPVAARCSPSMQMQQLVEGSLGGWAVPLGELSPPTLPSPPLPDQGPISGRIFLVDIPGATQTSVAVGEPGASGGAGATMSAVGWAVQGEGGNLVVQASAATGLLLRVRAGGLCTRLSMCIPGPTGLNTFEGVQTVKSYSAAQASKCWTVMSTRWRCWAPSSTALGEPHAPVTSLTVFPPSLSFSFFGS